MLAALAMVMTIPGRTQGLGLITEPVLEDPTVGLDRTTFALLNLVATLAGAVFALPFGWFSDRLGVRLVLTLNLALLGAATWAMAGGTGVTSFFLGMLLMRGLGQSGLSTTSLTLVGKWFPERLPQAMAVFSVASGLGFMALFLGVGASVRVEGWRPTWSWMGMGLLAFAAVAWLLCRNPVAPASRRGNDDDLEGVELKSALCSWPFWLLALSSGLFNWVSSGIGLFNQDVLRDLHFDRPIYESALGTAALFTLITNFFAGTLATRHPLGKLMAIGMLALAACLTFMPFMTATWHVHLNAALLGTSAGLVMVVFFACWGMYFGRRHLGKIQGCAQAITVLASALGPVSLALSKEHYGSYQPLFLVLAGLAVVSAVALLRVKRPGM
jgi:MFS family permease